MAKNKANSDRITSEENTPEEVNEVDIDTDVETPEVSENQEAQEQETGNVLKPSSGDSWVNIEKTARNRSEAMRKILEAQPKVVTFIPLDANERRGEATLEVGINGCFYSLPKGRQIEVPTAVAKIVYDHLGLTEEARDQFKVDRDPVIANALD